MAHVPVGGRLVPSQSPRYDCERGLGRCLAGGVRRLGFHVRPWRADRASVFCAGLDFSLDQVAHGITTYWTTRATNTCNQSETIMTTSDGPSVIHLHAADNVCIATKDLAPGRPVNCNGHTFEPSRLVEMGHKMAVRPIAVGQPVIKYGQTIGMATQPVSQGDWVHTHNLELGELRQNDTLALKPLLAPSPIEDKTFLGYRRENGKVGTRNYIGVISNVNCSASVAKQIARRFEPSQLHPFPNVDGVVSFTHEAGCGMPFGGTAHDMLNRVLGGIARHPNIGAYLLVGLGCEQADMNHLLEQQRLVQIDEDGTQHAATVFSIQQQGGTAKTVEAGVRAIEAMLPRVNQCRRKAVPASEIILATECGGSDGYSGITANPGLGAAADLVVACGGTVILGETTEIYGAEHLLTCRAQSVAVAEKLLARIQWWKQYVGLFGAELDNNPSVGNKKGGLTTIAEKSLGAIAKAGSTALVDVYEYACRVKEKGLVVMDTPGYDPPSVTGMVAGGANVVVFTTGRGSCFGSKPAPTIKVATNTPMYERMKDDMDIDAGVVLAGMQVADLGKVIFDEILDVASGKKTKSEQLGIGDEEFFTWTVGPML